MTMAVAGFGMAMLLRLGRTARLLPVFLLPPPLLVPVLVLPRGALTLRLLPVRHLRLLGVWPLTMRFWPAGFLPAWLGGTFWAF